MSDVANDQLHCWQQVERNDPLFRVTHAFTARELADRVLALNAFLAATGEICSMVADEGVAVRKLAWWRDEMHGGAGSGRPHPITSELRRTGAYELIGADHPAQHFEQAVARFDPAPLRSVADLMNRCALIGRPMLEMECAVCEVPALPEPWVSQAATRRGLVQLIREDFNRQDAWWLPLELLARHGLSRPSVNDRADERADQDVLTDLLQNQKLGLSSKIKDISNIKHEVRRLFCSDQLLINKLKNRNIISYDKRRKLLSNASVRDALTCWRAARRVSSSK